MYNSTLNIPGHRPLSVFLDRLRKILHLVNNEVGFARDGILTGTIIICGLRTILLHVILKITEKIYIKVWVGIIGDDSFGLSRIQSRLTGITCLHLLQEEPHLL
jgi:hypothetical protein